MTIHIEASALGVMTNTEGGPSFAVDHLLTINMYCVATIARVEGGEFALCAIAPLRATVAKAYGDLVTAEPLYPGSALLAVTVLGDPTSERQIDEFCELWNQEAGERGGLL